MSENKSHVDDKCDILRKTWLTCCYSEHTDHPPKCDIHLKKYVKCYEQRDKIFKCSIYATH